LRDALFDAGVPTVYVEFARTPHAFDLVIPPLFGPAWQAALYDVERFLACVATQTPAAQAAWRERNPHRSGGRRLKRPCGWLLACWRVERLWPAGATGPSRAPAWKGEPRLARRAAP
jgi:hypothetical protein